MTKNPIFIDKDELAKKKLVFNEQKKNNISDCK